MKIIIFKTFPKIPEDMFVKATHLGKATTLIVVTG